MAKKGGGIISLYEKLVKKIDAEFEVFYLTLRTMDASEIFQKSTEIEAKRTIMLFLKKELMSVNETVGKKLLYTDSLLSEVYRYVCDHREKSVMENIKDFIHSVEMKKGKEGI